MSVVNNKKLSYISEYNKNHYKMYQFRVKKDDQLVINKLDSIMNRSGYINSLVKNDIASSVLTIKQIKQKIKPVIDKHGIDEVYLFGSYARGEANSNSDVDIYCSSGDIETLINEVELIEELEEVLNKKVDIVTIGSHMHECLRRQLEEDKIRIF